MILIKRNIGHTLFFFVINIFLFFSHITQHSIQNITKQNNRHILNISKSSQRAGHTLDLVLSLGLSVTNVVVNDACFSDHLFVCFDAAFSSLNSVSNRSGLSTRLINTSTVD